MNKIKVEILNRDDVIAVANLDKLGLGFTADFFMKILRLDQFNQLYERVSGHNGLDFIDAAFEDVKVKYIVDETDLQKIPKTGPFIVVANHPFGMLDGLMLIRVIAAIRPDFKVMANFFLQKIEPIHNFFISVDPFDGKQTGSNYKGMRSAFEHVLSGKPLGIFPAGEVSTYQAGFTNLRDRKWQPTAIKIIRKTNVPVIPVYFHGSNSMTFHLLGKIHPMLRTAKIPSEIFNQENNIIPIRIGAAIPVKEQDGFNSLDEFGNYLKARVYALGTAIENKSTLFNLPVTRKPAAVVEPMSIEVIEKEIRSLRPDSLVHSKNEFEVYLTESKQIPNTLQEIGRLRELTFRKVGEGTNKSIDLDGYDPYYHHLFLWDKQNKKIVGGYRLGRGDELYAKSGQKGFYISTLFNFEEEFIPILKQSLELGRSFVAEEYQKRTFPLFLLWKGIENYLRKNRQYKYLIGPVSISNYYSDFSKSFLISFIKKYYYNDQLAALVKARKVYEVREDIHDFDVLVEKYNGDMKEVDKLISEIEPARYKVPVLLKKYIRQNARIVGFNIDPEFNDCLDGLMVLDLDQLPDDSVYDVDRILDS